MLLLAGEDDLSEVILAVADLDGRWKGLGISLGVHQSDLDTIQSNNPHSPSDCLREMLALWLKQNYTVRITFMHTASCIKPNIVSMDHPLNGRQ